MKKCYRSTNAGVFSSRAIHTNFECVRVEERPGAEILRFMKSLYMWKDDVQHDNTHHTWHTRYVPPTSFNEENTGLGILCQPVRHDRTSRPRYTCSISQQSPYSIEGTNERTANDNDVISRIQ